MGQSIRSNDLTPIQWVTGEDISNHASVLIVEMVADTLRDAAKDLIEAEQGLNDAAFVLTKAECLRQAKRLNTMADRLMKKSSEGYNW